VEHPRRRGLHRDSHVGHHVRRDCTLRHGKCSKLAGQCGERPNDTSTSSRRALDVCRAGGCQL
jgi:hypothetical protein